jgi:hypothetical protein
MVSDGFGHFLLGVRNHPNPFLVRFLVLFLSVFWSCCFWSSPLCDCVF